MKSILSATSLAIIFACLCLSTIIEAFCPASRLPSRQLVVTHTKQFAKEQSTDAETPPVAKDKDAAVAEDQPKKKPKGDSIRSATGIRPSLHPVTINCIAEALLMRSKQTPETTIDIANSDIEPIQIAITAGSIAMNAIDQRKSAAETDETTDEFSMDESNVISGRVVGVVMRMRELEQLLRRKVGEAEYVWKYGEEMSFGLLKKECKVSDVKLSDELEKELGESIKMNPLLRMNRAECLLALFIETVEKPKLEMIGEEVAGGSKIDFIDGDRLEVLFKE